MKLPRFNRRANPFCALAWAAAWCALATGCTAAPALSAPAAPIPSSTSPVAKTASLPTAVSTPATKASQGKIYLGIDVLAAQKFAALKGKRIGLLTNPAGVNRDGVSTIDVLRAAPGVNLVALFGPEHGIYGDEKAATPVPSHIDKRTGLMAYSLFGDSHKKPSPEMLKGIDAIVVDLQDIGTRSYTYISCVRDVMEGCFAQNKEVIILDRPDPLGGIVTGGPPMEKSEMSYVGDYPIPYVYGLTIGELATAAKNTSSWLDLPDDVRKNGRLTVIPMQGWRRSMLWPDTGLKWRQTSPNVPSTSAAFGYPLTGLGAIVGDFSHGVGTPLPFRLLNYPDKKPAELAAILNGYKMGGVSFVSTTYKDDNSTERSGVFVRIENWNAVVPGQLALVMMKLSAAWSANGNPFAKTSAEVTRSFDIHIGSSSLLDELARKGTNADFAGTLTRWQTSAAKFHQWSKQWWLYPE